MSPFFLNILIFIKTPGWNDWQARGAAYPDAGYLVLEPASVHRCANSDQIIAPI